MGDATLLVAILSGVTVPLVTLAVGIFYQRKKNGSFEKDISELKRAIEQRDAARRERDDYQRRYEDMLAERSRLLEENIRLLRQTRGE